MLARTIAEEKRSQTKWVHFLHETSFSQRFSSSLTDEFLIHLGYDWLLLFLQPHLHPRTLILTTKLLVAFLLSSSNALTRFRDNAMLMINSSASNSTSTSVSSPSSNTAVATPLSPLATSMNDSWITVFNERPANKATFALGIDPTVTMSNNNNASIALPGFVLLQYLLAQRAEIIPIYYQLIVFIFRQPPSDENMEQTEVSAECPFTDEVYRLVFLPFSILADSGETIEISEPSYISVGHTTITEFLRIETTIRIRCLSSALGDGSKSGLTGNHESYTFLNHRTAIVVSQPESRMGRAERLSYHQVLPSTVSTKDRVLHLHAIGGVSDVSLRDCLSANDGKHRWSDDWIFERSIVPYRS